MTIGFLFYDFSDTRALDVITGLQKKSGDHQLVLFPAGPLNSPSELEENDRALLLKLLRESELDALVTLQFWESENWFQQVLLDNLSFPVIPLLRDFQGCHYIHVPYDEGMYRAVSHLIEDHNCRKLIFCIGSATETASLNKRFEGFKKALADHHIEYEPYMLNKQKGIFISGGIVSGVFHQGNKVVHELFIEKEMKPGRDVDGLVVFNDRMAIEILESLHILGIKIPEELKLISHDNIIESELSEPPLTTIAMDWFEMGCQSISLLEQPGAGKTVTLNPFLKIRRSCGCKSTAESPSGELNREEDEFQDQSLQPAASPAVIFAASSAEKLKTLRQIHLQERRINVIIQNMVNVLAECNSSEEVLSILQSGLDALNIKNCSIFLADLSRGPEQFRNVFHISEVDAFKPETGHVNRKDILSFCTKQFGSHFVIEPLNHGERFFGFLCVGLDIHLHSVYDDLRRILSNALYSQSLLRDLKDTQNYLIQSEKFSALGELVAGVAHEVNTPLGVGITASSHIRSLLDKIKLVDGDLSCTQSEYVQYLEDLYTSSDLVSHNLLRSAELIKKFKSITADTSSVNASKFEVGTHLYSIIDSLSPFLERDKILVDIDCPEEIFIYSYSGLFTQFITNLLMNSVYHGFRERSQGHIHIAVHRSQNNHLIIRFKDDGSGMSDDVLDKVFDPFFTTQRKSGRTGLGMFITYNIITQKLKGKIDASSQQGLGSSFKITIPLSS